MEKNSNRASSCTSLAQAVDPRSSERGEVPRFSYNYSETHQALTSSHLSETLSLERDASSLKTKALLLSESSSRNQGKAMLFSPRRDKLAWAKILVLATVQTRIK
ncbi:hypothetical protein DEO72_LG8g2200 [Vigna unguiculata]|uniref:Uncharacterized protein n=1 Tax=Vigna unguiculata TaxID=3917 RepID=A0A4D6MW90_VIGUN|nr:hypothetical protein DEO72_LG8g2200 [Vigna unguiculata]